MAGSQPTINLIYFGRGGQFLTGSPQILAIRFAKIEERFKNLFGFFRKKY